MMELLRLGNVWYVLQARVIAVTLRQMLVVGLISEQSSVTESVVLLLQPILPTMAIAVTLQQITVEILMLVLYSVTELVVRDLNLLIVTHVLVHLMFDLLVILPQMLVVRAHYLLMQ